jgi:flavin reductase ActVB
VRRALTLRAVPEADERVRQVLRRVATPVVLVSAAGSGGAAALRAATVGSFASVSMEPPVVSFALKNPSRLSAAIAALRPDGLFRVHVLGAQHRPLAERFAQKHDDSAALWRELGLGLDGGALPVLPDAAGVLDCTVHSRIDLAHRTVWYGLVVSARCGEAGGECGDESPEAVASLLYAQRAYHRVGPALK